MFQYILSLLNEIVNFNEFSLYLSTNFNLVNNDYVVLCYFLFIFLIVIILLIITLGLTYFIKHSRNTWFGRRRY